ncbi:hypothetical protein JOF56_009269 [Kibdelosporangium banguiense]|uniref:Uncharacterized protein n=1 Tax=Kibdelosporangium banguiense TaxID=1365924 RepID=A0ABS4TY19_9PSEU|nr:hypothetical protein [Kibdelosporangium banguiense]MBP2328884.1 hypothetical protein [Kibdelosporangium banguiense]
MTDSPVPQPAYPQRPRYLEGQVLGLCDLVGEQGYRVDMRYRHELELHDGNPAFDETTAPGTGKQVVAAAVQAPGGAEMVLEPTFTVRVPGAQGSVRELLCVAPDGVCAVAEPLTAQDMTVDVLEIGSTEEPQARAMPWNCHRPGGAERRESRIELESPLIPGAVDRSRFVVGLSSSRSTFDPMLTVDAGGNTAVRGRLKVRGPIVHAAPDGVPAETPALGVSVRLGQDEPDSSTSTKPVDILAMNLSAKLIRTSTFLLVTDAREPKVVSRRPFLRSGDVISVSTTVDSAVQKVTASVFGVLPGGVLCHASAVLDLS